MSVHTEAEARAGPGVSKTYTGFLEAGSGCQHYLEIADLLIPGHSVRKLVTESL